MLPAATSAPQGRADARPPALPQSAQQLLQLIKGRRSIYPKDYCKHTAVGIAEVRQLLEAAEWAPSHGQTFPWRWTVVKQGPQAQEMLDLTAECQKDKMGLRDFSGWQAWFDKRRQAFQPVQYFIVICCKRQARPGKLMEEWEELAATASAVQNLQLMCHACGLAGYWSSWWTAAREHAAFKKWLNLEPEDTCMGVFMLGHPGPHAAAYRGSRGPVDAKIDWRC